MRNCERIDTIFPYFGLHLEGERETKGDSFSEKYGYQGFTFKEICT